MSDQTVRIVKPQELNDAELESVQALIVEGGEVRAASLRDNLKFSRFIALIVREGQLACVGAIKEARPGYIQTISRKSGYALDAENCVGEFGYVVTKAAFRKQGSSRPGSQRWHNWPNRIRFRAHWRQGRRRSK